MPLVLNGTTGVSGVDGSAGTPAVQGTDSNTGIVFGADTISLVEGGTAAFSVDSSANASLVGTLAMGSSFLRNRIINGDMRIDQRNAGASVTISNGSVTFITDRWNVYEDTPGAITSQRSTVAPFGFNNSLLVSVTSAGSATSGQLCRVQQRVEGFNTADLGWGTTSARTVSVSFWVRSSLTGTYCVSALNEATNRSHVATYSINASNTWEYKTVTITGDVDTGATWKSGNGIGIYLNFDLGSGSGFNATAGVWNAADRQNTSAQANWIGTASSTFYITGVQLEVGSVATPFERRQFGQELALCQRYYQTLSDFLISGYNGSGSTIYNDFPLPVPMRILPAVSIGAITYSNASSYALNTASPSKIRLSLVINSTGYGFGYGGALLFSSEL